MFGVVPKGLWERTNPADEKNLCTWAMRSLLIEDGERLILIDTGIGDKQSEKFFGHYHLHGDNSLDKSLANYGFSRNDITDVFITHLHFATTLVALYNGIKTEQAMFLRSAMRGIGPILVIGNGQPNQTEGKKPAS